MAGITNEQVKKGRNKRILLFILLTVAAFFLIYRAQIFFETKKITSPFWFVDATAESGLNSHLHPPVYNENPSYLEIMGGGVAVGDFDGDGYEDIFFATMPSFDPNSTNEYKSALYRNQGDGTFVNVTSEAGLVGIQGYPMGALFFDYNNNGRQDLYVAAYNGGRLFENRGGYFADVTESAGLSMDDICGGMRCMTAAASAADYNKSGFLDLLVINNVGWDIDDEFGYGLNAMLPYFYPSQPVVLFKNNGDGTFSNVSEETGVTNADLLGHGNEGKGLSAVWTDVNNNGWPDVYIANDTTPSRLYVNNRDGTFRDISVSASLDEMKSSMGIDTADFNNNGRFDLITTNLEGDMISLFRNYGEYRFDYVTASTGLIPSGRGSGWGVLFVDLDLDGHQDLVIANGALLEAMRKDRENENIFFHNNGRGLFRDVSDDVIRFSNTEYSRGMALIDIQNSGKPDLIIANIDGAESQLLVNKTENGNNRIRLDLEGTVSNRDAVGARVIVEREDGVVMRQIVKVGNSYQSSSSKSLFIGLGKSSINKLEIEWPSGRVDSFDEIPVNQIVRIKEGEQEGSPSVIQATDFQVN